MEGLSGSSRAGRQVTSGDPELQEKPVPPALAMRANQAASNQAAGILKLFRHRFNPSVDSQRHPPALPLPPSPPFSASIAVEPSRLLLHFLSSFNSILPRMR